MIHLSRFLIGIRHNRAFRIRSLSGQLTDNMLKVFPGVFEEVIEKNTNEEFILRKLNDTLKFRVNRDDIILDAKKIYDFKTNAYIEIKKDQIIHTAKKALPMMVGTLELKDDFVRIGMIFEFRLPRWESLKEDSINNYIYHNFMSFKIDEKIDQGTIGTKEIEQSEVHFAYKLRAPGGGAIRKLDDYRNVIIQINESTGIDEEGKEQKCLLINADIQHIFKPLRKDVDVQEHYEFAKSHLTNVILPEFKSRGVDINYE